ncbi:hypothetical protein ACFQX8_03660 [Klenkia terrae]|uniref:hypothetical protein n=1 Tax=Klenkia terrae TaxID=1052259 RepID=UPI003615DE7A
MTTPLASPEEIKANAEASLAEIPHPRCPRAATCTARPRSSRTTRPARARAT